MAAQDQAGAESDRFEAAPHPRDTPLLFGQARAEAAMLEAYRSGHLAHAWLIGGPKGVGKATLAWRFARFLMAYPDPARPEVQRATDLGVPERHPIWARLRSGAHGDVAVLRREWNERSKKFFGEIRVDDVRDALGLFQRAAGAGGFRICILDSAEDLNRSSGNALLKVIEEPPQRSLFLIIAHRPAQVLPTIRSRCRKLILPALDATAVRKAVEQVRSGDDATAAEDLDAVIARCDGSVARALELLDETRLGLDRELGVALDRLPAVDWRGLHRLADRLSGLDRGQSGLLLADTVLEWIDRRAWAGARGGAHPARLARLAEVWDKVRAAVQETEALNLDLRPLILSIFTDLAQAMRLAGLDGIAGSAPSSTGAEQPT